MVRKVKPQLTLVGHISALALAYAIAGWIGLLLIDPALHGVLIWPAAGVASGVLILQGRRLWPGILVGFAALHWSVTQGMLPGVGPQMVGQIGFPAGIAAMVQALVAATLVKRRLGFPVRLATRREIVALMLRAGPIACAISATIGVMAAWRAGLLPVHDLGVSWLKWWVGDLVGVIIALPAVLYYPKRTVNAILWQERPIARPNSVATLVGAIGLAASIFVSVSMTEVNQAKNDALFTQAVDQNAVALQFRLISLSKSIETAKEFIGVSNTDTASGWHRFVRNMTPSALAGADGFGFIQAVAPSDTSGHRDQANAAGAGVLTVSPQEAVKGLMVVKFFETLGHGSNMRGFDLGSVKAVRDAARSARESGKPEIAPWYSFSDRGTKTTIYILLQAVYGPGGQPQTVQQRRAAFEGWVFMPLNADRAFKLSPRIAANPVVSQLSIGAVFAPPAQAMDAVAASPSARFETSRSFDFFQQHWVVTYHRTPWFEASTKSSAGQIVLAGGLAMTALIVAFIMLLSERERAVRDQVAQRTEDLEIQNRKTQSILDNAVVGIFLLDRHGKILSANSSAPKIFGIARDDLIGKHLRDILPDIAALSDELSPKQLSFLTSFEKAKIVTPAGNVRWVKFRANSFVGEFGEVIATLVVHDISETVRVSEKISEQEKRWNLALEGSQIGVFDVDLATGHGVASETWRALAGFGFDEFTDSEAEWKARIDPRDWPHVRQANIACIKGEAVKMQAEYRFRADDGRWHWMRSEARVIARDAHGRALRLLGTMTDITPLREALNRVKSREAELERLIASAPVAMTVLALDGTFLMANPAFGLFAGYPEASLIGRKLQDLPMTGERLEDRDEIHQMLAGTLDYYNTEKHYIQPDGTEVFGLMSYTILRGNDGEEPRFICQILDITERKRLDQMRADFVATVSHELRTPLTSINGSLKLVLGLMSKELPTKALHLLTVAHQNFDRLGRLVNDLLDMQKFASGKSTLEMERCEVTQIVRQTLVDNASYGQKFSVRFKPLVSIAQIWSRIDVNRFQQVMANLLSNAAKFSPEGGEVITEVRRTDKMLVVSVTNSGLGIPPEFRDKIFTPFTQASDTSTRDREGSGLGLVISKEIVERMGGEIGYESVPGGSTTFWIKLPLDETEDAASDLDGGADAMSAYAELRKGNL